MTNAILPYVKKMLGLEEDYHPFDPEIAAHINSVFLTLNQLGVGVKGFEITLEGEGDNLTSPETWDDFIDGAENMNAVKTYVWTKVKMAFDPPASSVLMESLNRIAEELEFRLMSQVVDNKKAAELENA